MKTVFSNVDSKDIFMESYNRLLSKRLLGDKNVSLDTEKAVVSLMKMQCGTSFTIKAEGMITDYSLAEDIYSKWSEEESGRRCGEVRAVGNIDPIVQLLHISPRYVCVD